MNKCIVSMIDKKGRELYLTETELMQFSEGIANAIPFESETQARDKLTGRFLALCNWIINQDFVIDGVFICSVLDDNIVGRIRYI